MVHDGDWGRSRAGTQASSGSQWLDTLLKLGGLGSGPDPKSAIMEAGVPLASRETAAFCFASFQLDNVAG